MLAFKKVGVVGKLEGRGRLEKYLGVKMSRFTNLMRN